MIYRPAHEQATNTNTGNVEEFSKNTLALILSAVIFPEESIWRLDSYYNNVILSEDSLVTEGLVGCFGCLKLDWSMASTQLPFGLISNYCEGRLQNM